MRQPRISDALAINHWPEANTAKGYTLRKHPRCPGCGARTKTATRMCPACRPASAAVATIPWQEIQRDPRFAELDREIRDNGGEYATHEGRQLLDRLYREALLEKGL
jgi:hypothetical protein